MRRDIITEALAEIHSDGAAETLGSPPRRGESWFHTVGGARIHVALDRRASIRQFIVEWALRGRTAARLVALREDRRQTRLPVVRVRLCRLDLPADLLADSSLGLNEV